MTPGNRESMQKKVALYTPGVLECEYLLDFNDVRDRYALQQK